MIKDVLIIGCGPTGLYAWKLAADLNLSGVIIDIQSSYGGQVSNYYPDKMIKNFPAIPEIKASDAMDQMYNAINKQADIELKLNTKVKSIQLIEPQKDEKILHKNWFNVKFSDETSQQFKRILFADGVGIYTPIRLTEEDYNNVFYTVTDVNTFKDKDIIIFGGGDSAIDWANEIKKIAKTVKVIHRREEFRAQPGNINAAKDAGVEFYTPYTFTKIINNENNSINKIEIKNAENNQKKVINCDYIVVQFGQQIIKNKFKNINLNIDHLNRIVVNYEFKSNVEGIYAAGDCCYYPTKTRSVISGIFEAMQAIINIEKIINNRKIANTGW